MKNSILAVINQKGGVGKTTTVINLASALSILGQNTLIIDLDPQGNATTGLGRSNNDEEKNIYNLLIKKKKICGILQETVSILGNKFLITGAVVSFTLKPNSNGFMTSWVFASLISKWRWGPDDPPVFPEYAITSPSSTLIAKLSK